MSDKTVGLTGAFQVDADPAAWPINEALRNELTLRSTPPSEGMDHTIHSVALLIAPSTEIRIVTSPIQDPQEGDAGKVNAVIDVELNTMNWPGLSLCYAVVTDLGGSVVVATGKTPALLTWSMLTTLMNPAHVMSASQYLEKWGHVDPTQTLFAKDVRQSGYFF